MLQSHGNRREDGVETGILAGNDLSLAGHTANLEHLIRLADCGAKRKAIQCVIDEAESNGD
jgi:hypothetical protein